MSEKKKEQRGPLVDRFGRPMPSRRPDELGQKAKRNFNRLSAIVIGASALVAAVVALLVNFDTLCERFCPPSPEPKPNLEDYLAADYWRMTGAFEVPFFLLEGPNIARCADPSAIDLNRANCVFSDEIGQVWRTELAGALLVDDGLIDQGNIRSGLREILFASTGREVVDSIYCAIMEMDGGIELQLDDSQRLSRTTIDTYLGADIQSDRLFSPVSEDPDCSLQHSREIGYLILRLRNVTDKPITGVQISFRSFQSSGPLGSERETNDMLLTSIREQNPIDFNQWILANEAVDLQDVIASGSSERRRLPDLLPGDSVLIPIYLFRADKDGFEKYFYRDWRLPSEITFATSATEIIASVPFPARDAAAVVRTYNGWYQQ